MYTETLQPNLNLQSIIEFVRLSKSQQSTMLLEEGVLLDLDTEKTTITRLYFLKGFFVEEVFCKKLNEIVEIIPYRQGYRLKSFIKSGTCSILERPFYFQYCIN